MQLRFLIVSGPASADASVEFGPGLNVIYGGSNTGKSYVLRLIDYALGASAPPDPIVEQAGYDQVQLGIVLEDGTEKTLFRALQGGDIRIVDGLAKGRISKSDGVAVSAKHSAKASLSKVLLSDLGAAGARIRTDAAGKTRDLSFRDLERFALVNETKIQETSSPVLSGQFVTKTAETSVFKYLLTGVDDSALDVAKPDSSQPLRQAAQLELLDRQIRETETELERDEVDHEELESLDRSLDEALASRFEVQELSEAGYRDLTGRRRSLLRRQEEIDNRVAEIHTLKARFRLLSEHYQTDSKRLAAIAEAGAYFAIEGSAVCPICGAEPSHHRPEKACEGDVATISKAALAEGLELRERAADLQTTLNQFQAELEDLAAERTDVTAELERVFAEISKEVPSVQAVRSETNRLLQQKLQIQKGLSVVRRRENLVAQRAELGVSPGYDSSTIVAQQHLDGAVLDSFSQAVEAELQAWDFPDAKRIFFELQKMDISVAGKSRSANGKGVRALLHGAFSVALMKFCRAKNRAHPGFLVLDSLFITYKDPADSVEASIASTPLKDRAFRSFSELTDDLQLIVLENVDVPEWLVGADQCIRFTGEATVGRAGLFPPIGSSE